MNNNRGNVKQDTRDLVWMFLKILPGQETIEEGLWFRQDGWLYSLRPYRSRIMGSSSTKFRPTRILSYD